MDSNLYIDEYIDLQKYWLVLKRRWLSATVIFFSVVGLALVASLFLEKVYEAEAELLIKTNRTSKLTGLENETGEIDKLTTESDPIATEVEIVQSRPIVEKLIRELDLRNEDNELFKYKEVASSLKVKPIIGTDLLQVSYIDTDPELATLIVNKIVELYIEDDRINNRSETVAARGFIDQQLPKLEANVRKAEANLRNFKNQNQIASLTEETSSSITSISNIANQIDTIEADLEDVNARYQRLSMQLNMNWQEASAISSLSQSLAVQRVLEQLQEVKVALVKKRNYLSDNAPQIITLKEEEADLNALLNRQIAQTLDGQQQAVIENVNILSLGDLKQAQIAELASLGVQKEGLEQKLSNLRQTYDDYRRKSASLPRLQEQQRELERRVKAAQSTYQTLLGKLQEAQISEEQNIGNVRVVAEAVVPDEPVGPNRKLIVGGAGFLGALLGIGGAFLLDMQDKTVKNTDEIEALLPYPLQGIVPNYNTFAPKKEQFLLPDDTTGNLPQWAVDNLSELGIKEAYHNIQINLKLLNRDRKHKVIVVTSAASGEGKSSVASNLAIAKAQCGLKVLLVDGDLRCPIQHEMWGIPNDLGLTNVLDQEVAWYDILYQAMSNLDIMTSGTTYKHPISLLNSSLMEDLIVSAIDYYDYIIIDSPPLLGLADTKVLSKLVDGLLFVVRPGLTTYKNLAAAKKMLAAKDFQVFGTIANGVNSDRNLYDYGETRSQQKYLNASNSKSF